MDHDGHNLTGHQLRWSVALASTLLHQTLVPYGFKRLAEIIDIAEQFQYTQHGDTFQLGLVARKAYRFH
jgi:hypothetical protein